MTVLRKMTADERTDVQEAADHFRTARQECYARARHARNSCASFETERLHQAHRAVADAWEKLGDAQAEMVREADAMLDADRG